MKVHPCVFLEFTKVPSDLNDAWIELDDIDDHLREMAVKEPRQRTTTQADDESSEWVLSERQTGRQHPSVRQFEMRRIPHFHDTLPALTCAKPKTSQAVFVLCEQDRLER
jgi:hypothetical protein